MGFFEGRKVLVTGAAGFIGTNLVERLVRDGAVVRAADSFERTGRTHVASLVDAAEVLEGDLRDRDSCLEACRGAEVVFHLAARAGSSDYYRRHPATVLNENLVIDAQVLEAARRRGVERYFYTSSVFVYPRQYQMGPEPRPLREEDALPASPPLSYGWAKLMGEKALEYAVGEDHSFRAAVFRLIGAYGPHQDLDDERGSVIPVLIRRAIEYPAQPFAIRGAGQELRSFCYISDVIDAMLLAVEKLDGVRLLGPLNVGSEESVPIINVVEEIVRMSGKSIPIVQLPAAGPVWSQAVDCSRAREALDGWTPKVPLAEGVRRTFAYVEAVLERRQVADVR
ncbi:MAG: NAD-dependent epimerase/dehydratase family protein [Chloroflexi bacterium]|nr:NAD-dependent epimerase/dehydratase family protein [Chloroflexota bacterium]